MKKEKKVRTYQRRTKTGKLVTVKQHTAKYDAAEKAKEMLKKKGAGDELSAKKKAKPVSSAGELDFSQADFKAWYHWDQENDPKNPAALKVEKALKAKMGARAYRKFFDDMSDSYSARGHLKAYKECQSCGDKGESKSTKTTKVKEPKTSKSETSIKKSVDTPKSSKGTRMKGEKEGERDSYYGTGTLDAKYEKAMKAAKSGDAKAYRKAMEEYSTAYSHHGDHFDDKASRAYREKQTSALKKASAKMGVDYLGHKEAPKVSDVRVSKASKEWGVSSEAIRYWYEEGIGKNPTKPSKAVMKEVRQLDKMVDKVFGPTLIKHLDDNASETTNVYVYALRKSKKEIQSLREKMDGKNAHTSKSPKSSEKTTKTEAKSKRLRRELAEAQTEESRSKVKSATRKSEAAFEKAGVSRKDVSAFMKSSPRKWTYDREEGVYKTMVMPDGKGRARGAYKMSVAAAIKKFKEAKKTKLPAHYVNRYKKEMSELPPSEWEKLF